jgi:membrane protein YqaA with SNARE-associated domain
MDRYRVPHWLQAAIAASGGLGLFLVAFLDSTVLPFPSVNDLLLIDLSIQSPARMVYYASMATLGSLAGCMVLFLLARKGEEAAFHQKAGAQAPKIQRWMRQNGFVTILVAALLPPPTPFKFFVLAAGVFGMPWRSFALAIAIARTVRFFGEGYLAVRYGPQAASFLGQHRLGFVIGSLITVLGFYFIVRVLLPRDRIGKPN